MASKDDPLVLAGDFNTKPEAWKRQCYKHAGCGGDCWVLQEMFICVGDFPDVHLRCLHYFQVVVSKIFYFHLDPWGDDPIWRSCFSNGLVQPPNRFALSSSFFSVHEIVCSSTSCCLEGSSLAGVCSIPLEVAEPPRSCGGVYFFESYKRLKFHLMVDVTLPETNSKSPLK